MNPGNCNPRPIRSGLATRLAALLLLVGAFPAQAIPPLTEPEWLLSGDRPEDVVLLDIQDAKAYAKFHIPGSVNAPYSRWRTAPPAKPTGNLPPVGQLEKMIGELGIGNEDTVLIVSTGQGASDLAASARVFWTFRVLGHDAVSVLDGGLIGYYEASGKKGPLASGMESRPPATFRANIQPQLIATSASVKRALESGADLVDARSRGEFVGVLTAGPDERPGTVPGSRNLPHNWLTVNQSAKLRDEDALRALFKAVEIPTEGKQIHYCHSGNRAALTWFAAFAVFGNEQASLYDASMKEWAAEAELPIEQEISICIQC